MPRICAYYLHAGSGCKLGFAALGAQRETIRQSKHPESGVLELGKAITCAILAMSLVMGELAFAQGYGNRNDRGQNERNQNNPGQRFGEQDRRDNDARQPDPGQGRGRPNFNNMRQDERGAGPDHDFRRGGACRTNTAATSMSSMTGAAAI